MAAAAPSEEKQEKSSGAPVLHAELQKALDGIRKERAFDAEAWIAKKCGLLNDYMRKCGLKGCVVNLSGGVDSAVTLGLLQRAKAQKDSPITKVLAVAQPIHSSDWAFNRADECAKAFSAELVNIDQTKVYDALKGLIDGQLKIEGNAFAAGQLRSYMRTPSVYYIAQLLSSQGTPSIVMGTGNKDEDGYLAYFCKAGDGVVDVQLLADLHKFDVFGVGKVLGVPKSILEAAPSADLWDAQTDEEELGFPYDFIELWTTMLDQSEADGSEAEKLRAALEKAVGGKVGEAAWTQFVEWGKKAVGIHKRNQHKINSPCNL